MDTPQVLLDHHLKALRLPTFLREYDKVAQQCADEAVEYPRYLFRLSELELLDRERRATERRIKQARFAAYRLHKDRIRAAPLPEQTRNIPPTIGPKPEQRVEVRLVLFLLDKFILHFPWRYPRDPPALVLKRRSAFHE